MNLYADFEYEIEQAVIQTREEVTEKVTEEVTGQVTEEVTDQFVDRFIKHSISNNKNRESVINDLSVIFGLSPDEAAKRYSNAMI